MILEFELENFIPLLTSNIKHIKMVTKEQINLFISRNGSSKSQVLKEMTPFPPDSSKFNEGGRKRIVILNNGKIYTLTSQIGKEGFHHFEVDGVNLNSGCTATAQRILAEQHFGVSQGCARILAGLHIAELFNVMSPSKRKDFFMELYPNDTTYAMGVYSKLKEEYNNLRGALKNQITRYAVEKQTLETLNGLSEEELVGKISKLDEEIKAGLLLSGSLHLSKEHPQLNMMHESLLASGSKLLRLSISNPEQLSMNQLMIRVENLQVSLKQHTTRQELYSNALAEMQQQVSLKDIQQDPKVLEQRAIIIAEDLKRLYDKKSSLKNLLNEHEALITGYESFGTSFVIALSEMKQYLINVTPSSTAEVTRQMFQAWEAKRDQIANEKSKTEKILEDKQHQLKHYLNKEDIDCPNCHSQFKVGVTVQDIKVLQDTINNLIKTVELYRVEIEKLEKLIDNDSEWFLSMQALYRFLQQQRYTNADLGKVIREFDIGKTSSVILVRAIDMLSDYDNVLENIKPLAQENLINNAQIQLLKQNYIGGLIKKIKSSEESINWHNRSIRVIQKEIRVSNHLLDQMNDYENARNTFIKQLGTFRKALEAQFQYQLKHEVDKGIVERTLAKNQHMSEIIRGKSLNSVVDSIDQDIKRLKRRTKIVKTLMDGLCPNKGLIGKLMLDFIKTFCGNANAIIKEFSSITLMLKPCNKDNGDLTYRFPVINGHNTEASDISECSAGESEILNWVIRKVGMRYKSPWFPMFMDEVGAFLDEINRGRFFSYLQEIFANKEHEQLFMVSHYVSQQGIFVNPNIISFNHEGLTIQGKINAHTTIQHG